VDGSPGDYTLELYDDAGALLVGATHGLRPEDADPLLNYTSAGNEDLEIRIRMADDRGGSPYWYLLSVTQEETE
jgi:hypothetical protein